MPADRTGPGRPGRTGPTAGPAAGPTARGRGWGHSYLWFVVPVLVMIGALYLLPIGQVLLVSVTQPEPGLDNYGRALGDEDLRGILWVTLRICLVTTTTAVLLGYLVAYVIAHVGPAQRRLLLAFVLIPFWISVLVRALAWRILLSGNGLVAEGLNGTLSALGLIDRPLALFRNELGVIIGMVHYLIPLAVFPLYTAMIGIDRRLMAASHSLGAGAWRTFASVWLPLSLPGVFGAAVLVFVFSLGFYVTPALLGGGRVVMISERVSVYVLTTPNLGLAAALASIMLAVTIVLLAALARVIPLDRALTGR